MVNRKNNRILYHQNHHLIEKSAKVKVGTDDYLRDIHVGDEIKDGEGRHYTIDAQGRAKALNGAGDYPLSALRGVEVLAPAPVIEKTREAAKAAKEALLKQAEIGSDIAEKYPRETAEGDGVQKRPYLKRRTNTTGRIRLSNLARKRGISGIDLRQVAEGAGIPVTFDDAHNATIDVKDGQRLLDAYDGQVGRKKLTVGVSVHTEIVTDDYIVQEVKNRGLLSRCIEKCGGPYIVTTDPQKVFTKFDAYLLLKDEDLADELRNRGYEVVAVKRLVI